jgi:hypothetical protein
MDLTLVKLCLKLITVVCIDNYCGLIALVNWYGSGLLPFLRQFSLIPHRVNEFRVIFDLPHKSVVLELDEYFAVYTFSTFQ